MRDSHGLCAQMKPSEKIRKQLQHHLVALISLFIAVSSLSYNTWRNEKSEYNRNQRWASFEVLLLPGEPRREQGRDRGRD